MTPEASSSGPVQAFVYWDYSCPFSYVGERRVARLCDERPLAVSWRPFELRPGIPEEGLPAKELGYPPDEWSRMREAVEEMASEMGLEFRMPGFVPRSREALQAATFAQDVGEEAFGRLHRALFRAYFVDGKNLGRRDVVLETAEASGVDPEALEKALEDERYEGELRRVREETERYDITGTPTFLIGSHKVVGAAPMEVLREAADRAGTPPAESGPGGPETG